MSKFVLFWLIGLVFLVSFGCLDLKKSSPTGQPDGSSQYVNQGGSDSTVLLNISDNGSQSDSLTEDDFEKVDNLTAVEELPESDDISEDLFASPVG